MQQTYCRIFDRLGLDYRPVRADSGAIGGSLSHEFHVLAESGEDAIAFSDQSDYAANTEMAEALAPTETRPAASEDMSMVATPDQHSIDEVSQLLSVDAKHCLKTLIVNAEDDQLIALVLRGDHELNPIKAEKIEAVASPLCFADEDSIKKAIGCAPGSIGPVGLTIPVYVDRSAAIVADFICGANTDGQHLKGVNWERDLPTADIVDIRNVVEGDPSPDGKGALTIKRGIEVGHIFQLGTKYSEALKASVLDENGKAVMMSMGCYGIGVSRVVAAAIEQNHDDNGILWPDALAPFQIALLPMNMHKSERVRDAVENLYAKLQRAGFDVLLDDRKERPGVMFADMELIGIPHRVVVGEKGLDKGLLEYKGRNNGETADSIIEFLSNRIKI